ncbi:hypothetical protein KM043_017870 [Ampulex compressa]|nr:hypothetical protein KM043_017870 [Ampulex compressa]
MGRPFLHAGGGRCTLSHHAAILYWQIVRKWAHDGPVCLRKRILALCTLNDFMPSTMADSRHGLRSGYSYKLLLDSVKDFLRKDFQKSNVKNWLRKNRFRCRIIERAKSLVS